jgi:hypothetical protein
MVFNFSVTKGGIFPKDAFSLFDSLYSLVEWIDDPVVGPEVPGCLKMPKLSDFL